MLDKNGDLVFVCPKCKGESYLMQYGFGNFYWIQCKDCDYTTDDYIEVSDLDADDYIYDTENLIKLWEDISLCES